jgi:nucleoside-diphosphate-sugar epimerase
MKTTIIGLGWLGLPLAKFFKSQGHEVCGTSRTPEKVEALNQAGYKTLFFDLFDTKFDRKMPVKFVKDHNIIINIAPGRRSINPYEYATCMTGLIDYFFAHEASHITFISTSSVFGDEEGMVDEHSKPSPISNSAIAHHAIEQYLMSYYPTSAVVLRLAGLIGPNLEGVKPAIRHPVYSLVKREEVNQGNTRVNLVHQFDVIQCIYAIVQQQQSAKILHACSLEHPSRKDYYTWAAQQLLLDTPKFSADNSLKEGKIVSAKHTLETLGVTLRYPSPFNMLAN